MLPCVYNNIQLYTMPVFQRYVYRRSHTLAFNTNEGKKLTKFPTSPPSTPYRKLDVYWMPITMVTVLSLLDGETHMDDLGGCCSTKDKDDGYQLYAFFFLTYIYWVYSQLQVLVQRLIILDPHSGYSASLGL